MKAIREEKGLTLEEAGEQLNIKCNDLEALEKEEFFSFPDRPFALTVLELYADFLGMNKEEVHREFSHIWPEYGPVKSFFKQRRKRTKKVSAGKSVGMAGAVAVIFLIVVGAFAFWQSHAAKHPEQAAQETNKGEQVSVERNGPEGEEPDKPEGPDEKAPQEAVSSAMKPDEVTTQAVEGQNISVEITTPEGECWVEVTADGEQVYYQLVPPDTKPLVFEADDELSVLIGDAAAARIKVNGGDLGVLGGRRVVVQRVFTSED